MAETTRHATIALSRLISTPKGDVRIDVDPRDLPELPVPDKRAVWVTAVTRTASGEDFIVGAASFEPNGDGSFSAGYGESAAIEVDPEWHRLGIATAIFYAVEEAGFPISQKMSDLTDEGKAFMNALFDRTGNPRTFLTSIGKLQYRSPDGSPLRLERITR